MWGGYTQAIVGAEENPRKADLHGRRVSQSSPGDEPVPGIEAALSLEDSPVALAWMRPRWTSAPSWTDPAFPPGCGGVFVDEAILLAADARGPRHGTGGRPAAGCRHLVSGVKSIRWEIEMKGKIRLSPDALRVESFETDAAARAGGTVQAHDASGQSCTYNCTLDELTCRGQLCGTIPVLTCLC